jgi:hypothetical protein
MVRFGLSLYQLGAGVRNQLGARVTNSVHGALGASALGP